jgi:hypothetical protein
MAYNNWYAKNNPDDLDDDGEQRIRGFQKEFSCGGPFLVAQLKKSTKLKVPTLDSSFVTAKKDLW